jgi:hypothetical protein
MKGKRPVEREALILEAFSQTIQEMGFKYVLPFTFMQANRNRTSHYLIFVCKNSLGYKVMKDIMAAESSEFEQGVASFGYSKSLSEEQTPLLFELSRPLDELGQQLLNTFAGETLTMEQVFNQHNVGTPFVKKNYKDVLIDLEEQKKIITEPSKRRKIKGRLTFADGVRVTFPKKGGS